MNPRRIHPLVVALLVLLLPAAALAQGSGASPSPLHRFTVSAGVSWAGGYEIGDRAAVLTSNQPGAEPPPFTLFEARSSLARVAGAEVRVGFSLTPALGVEVGGAYARPMTRVSISGDAEAGDAVFEGTPVSQYVLDASLVWQLPRLRLGARGRPYLIGGGGYLRQLYEGHSLVETGQLYHVGAGVRYWLAGAAGRGRAFGLRGEVRAFIRHDGVELDGRTRVYPAATLMLFVGV